MSSPASSSPAHTVLARVWHDLALGTLPADAAAPPSHPVPLGSRLATGDLAWAGVAAVRLLAGIRTRPDPDRIAVSFRSDRVLEVDGSRPTVWSPYSGFFRAADGWVRTHGNYPHHAARLLSALDLPTGAGADAMSDAVRSRAAAELVADVTAAGGMAVAVAEEDPARDAELRRAPLLDVRNLGSAAPRDRPSPDGAPLTGIRILDLTRVIAGPVCTRTLALLGADVLRIDPPGLPEPEWQHLDTGHGKRSAVLDARSDRSEALLAETDVVVLGYRPAAVRRLGLTAEELAIRHPGVIVAQLSAWGLDSPDRGGFDSLVQAASGIAMVESPDGDRPGALPAQALDHTAGHLLAAAVIALVRRQREQGGTWHVHTSLRRVAAELLGLPRSPEPSAETPVDLDRHTVRFLVEGRGVSTAGPVLPDLEFAAPHAWGSDQSVW